MYLDHFKLKSFPFSLTPNTDFYCQMQSHEAVFNVLIVSVQNGEGFIKVIGEVGSGKTILCRRLLNVLSDDYVSVYIPNPDLSPSGLRKAVAKELAIQFDEHIDDHALLCLISDRLIQLHAENKKVVMLVDEAQALKADCLEALRLMTNLETESDKLLQVVLFGQPELDTMLHQPDMRQLLQRITFSCRLAPISKQDMNNYIAHRLIVAGHAYDSIFTMPARKLLYKASFGIPRVINVLCHKALLVAYGKGKNKVTKSAMLAAIRDTDFTQKRLSVKRGAMFALGGVVVICVLLYTAIKFHYLKT